MLPSCAWLLQCQAAATRLYGSSLALCVSPRPYLDCELLRYCVLCIKWGLLRQAAFAWAPRPLVAHACLVLHSCCTCGWAAVPELDLLQALLLLSTHMQPAEGRTTSLALLNHAGRQWQHLCVLAGLAWHMRRWCGMDTVLAAGLAARLLPASTTSAKCVVCFSGPTDCRCKRLLD
jgi:hypothetical protein